MPDDNESVDDDTDPDVESLSEEELGDLGVIQPRVIHLNFGASSAADSSSFDIESNFASSGSTARATNITSTQSIDQMSNQNQAVIGQIRRS